MRRVALACSLLVLAGCPDDQPPAPAPTPRPAEPPAATTSADAAAPATPAQAAPAPPDPMEELAALGARMTFDHRPLTRATSGDITVVLERVGMLRRTKENLEKEPWAGATSEAEVQGHYLALQLGIEVGGTPWTALPPGQQVGEVRLLGVQFEDQTVAIESSSFEPVEGSPRSAYHYRRFVPPPHEDGQMAITVLVQVEGRDPVALELPPFYPLRKQPPPEAEKGEEKPPEERAPAEQPPAAKPPEETGEEEH